MKEFLKPIAGFASAQAMRLALSTKSFECIFIVGCQRSGTTLLGQILGAHPRAVLIDENHGLYDLIETMLSDVGNEKRALQKSLSRARGMYVKGSHFTNAGVLKHSVTHLVFKAPNTTYEYERLRKIYNPRMHFVFPVRDVRDVVCSMQRLVHIPMVENQVKRLGRHEHLAARFAEELKFIQNPGTADHVRKAMIWGIKSGLHAEFSRPPMNAFIIRYEDLVSDPNRWIHRLLDHVNLNVQSDGPNHHENVFQGFGPGLTERTREIDKTSIGRWQRQLSTDQENDIWNVAGTQMEAMGYQREISIDRPAREGISREFLSRPIVATGRGGSGTRLLSLALQEQGIFLGNRLNISEDSLEWVDLIYELSIKKLMGKLPSMAQLSDELTACAGRILANGHCQEAQQWGWKLPETMLILPEVAHAFPNAKFVHLVRHPLTASLRRTHVTSRLDNSIGEHTLLSAYRWLNWDRHPKDDTDEIRNAASWVYQVEQAIRFGRSLGAERYLEIKYEDLCRSPQMVSDRIAAFLGKSTVVSRLDQVIDDKRQDTRAQNDERADEVWSICKTTATALGYHFSDCH